MIVLITAVSDAKDATMIASDHHLASLISFFII